VRLSGRIRHHDQAAPLLFAVRSQRGWFMPQVVYGVIFHWLGGLASGSFYVPYKAVRKWSWEVYWLAGGFFSWIIAPWIMAFLLSENVIPSITSVLSSNPEVIGQAYMFGALWGIGGLTFGLTMRYLGMSLGMAVALGLCTVLGTLIPDIYKGDFIENLTTQAPYAVIILGLGVCLLGVVLAGVAGMSKEREMPEEQKKEAIKEFNFPRGIFIALISGLFSACMAFGLQTAEPVANVSLSSTVARLAGKSDDAAVASQVMALLEQSQSAEKTSDATKLIKEGEALLKPTLSAADQKDLATKGLFVGLPKLCVVLLGGFTTNFIWCLLLMLKNSTLYEFFTTTINDPDRKGQKVKINYAWNLFFSALAGTTWYFQFFFYSMGETRMGEYQFSSWTLHMASIIIFSSIWGLCLREWKGTSRFTKFILGVAIFTLIYSTIIVGFGNLMKQHGAEEIAKAEPAAVQTVDEVAPPLDVDLLETPVNPMNVEPEPIN
jgi:L-rhamnose-H+ transport protein